MILYDKETKYWSDLVSNVVGANANIKTSVKKIKAINDD